MSATFEIYRDKADEWRWRLIHDNGNIIADSGEGYASRDGVEEAVERVKEHGPDGYTLTLGPATFEVYEDEADEWRWRLRHRNGNVIADSGEGYASRSGAIDAIESVKLNAPTAPEREE